MSIGQEVSRVTKLYFVSPFDFYPARYATLLREDGWMFSCEGHNCSLMQLDPLRVRTNASVLIRLPRER